MPGWVREGAYEDAWDEQLASNEADIRLLYKDHVRPRIRCGYCERESRPESLRSALVWFHSHDCATLRIRDEFEAWHPSPLDVAGLYEEAA